MKRKQPALLVNPRLRPATATELREMKNAEIVERHAEALWEHAQAVLGRIQRARSSKPRRVPAA